eukprot:9207717-Pyramimonas_sp.AAC.1
MYPLIKHVLFLILILQIRYKICSCFSSTSSTTTTTTLPAHTTRQRACTPARRTITRAKRPCSPPRSLVQTCVRSRSGIDIPTHQVPLENAARAPRGSVGRKPPPPPNCSVQTPPQIRHRPLLSCRCPIWVPPAANNNAQPSDN